MSPSPGDVRDPDDTFCVRRSYGVAYWHKRFPNWPLKIRRCAPPSATLLLVCMLLPAGGVTRSACDVYTACALQGLRPCVSACRLRHVREGAAMSFLMRSLGNDLRTCRNRGLKYCGDDFPGHLLSFRPSFHQHQQTTGHGTAPKHAQENPANLHAGTSAMRSLEISIVGGSPMYLSLLTRIAHCIYGVLPTPSSWPAKLPCL